MNLAYWINSGWMWSCQREARAFAAATRCVAKVQSAVLTEIVAKNAKSMFGQQHDFASIRSVADFQRCVPLTSKTQVAAAVDEIAGGRGNVLTSEPVMLLEPTSGSTSGESLIPYTASLRRQFQRAIAAWIADVMRQRPMVRHGRAYWSISPAMGAERVTSGGIPIGFDDDGAYLSRMERYFLKHLLVVPTGIARLTSSENFRYCTLFHLLAAGDVSLISVWSPTFLTSLLSPLDAWADQLVDDLRRGRATPPTADDPGMSAAILTCRCSAKRASDVRQVLLSDDSRSAKLRRLWPRLDLISCWTDGTAGHYLSSLREHFPDIAIQPKGLISTEACISFPLVGQTGCALALRSHFFEFIPVELPLTDETPRLVRELDAGEQYEVVVTTGGGLYRYRLGDVVEVVGFLNDCPLLRFVGRAGRVSDLVGEKLNEAHVSQVLSRVMETHRIDPTFAMLVPSQDRPGYRLYLEAHNIERLRGAILQDVVAGLNENPHFQYAVDLGQLRPLELSIVDEQAPRLWQVYERVLRERGQKAGDIKPAALDSWVGWHDEFETAGARA